MAQSHSGARSSALTRRCLFRKEALWIAELEEKQQETDKDFLFCADIQGQGVNVQGQRVVLDGTIYDIQSFEYDMTDNHAGKLKIKFGANTLERRDVPDGWTLSFEDLEEKHTEDGTKRYRGVVNVSCWDGEKKRVLLRKYADLHNNELQKYSMLDGKTYLRSLSDDEIAELARKEAEERARRVRRTDTDLRKHKGTDMQHIERRRRRSPRRKRRRKPAR